jgi:ribosome-associated heat shock protein Hsp15
MTSPELPAVRLDLWLWAARWYKTRSLAKTAIETGRVTLDGQTVKPSRPARVGDRLEIVRAGERHEIEVRAVGDKRGSAAVAQAMYAESDASRDARLAEREKRRLAAAGYQPPGTKPDKRARRLIRALGDLDAL